MKQIDKNFKKKMSVNQNDPNKLRRRKSSRKRIRTEKPGSEYIEKESNSF